jgi:hypothetical protein
MIVRFRHYIHDGDYENLVESILVTGGHALTEDEQQHMGRPFNEVELDCELDTETGEVKILDARSLR